METSSWKLSVSGRSNIGNRLFRWIYIKHYFCACLSEEFLEYHCWIPFLEILFGLGAAGTSYRMQTNIAKLPKTSN